MHAPKLMMHAEGEVLMYMYIEYTILLWCMGD